MASLLVLLASPAWADPCVGNVPCGVPVSVLSGYTVVEPSVLTFFVTTSEFFGVGSDSFFGTPFRSGAIGTRLRSA
jgi:hypothetical protein